MFDTHCHLNFQAFEGRVFSVIERARKAGVSFFLIPGTDINTSKKAVKIANKFNGVYAAVGIHPHHIYQYQKLNIKNKKYILKMKKDINVIESLLAHQKVVAVGEIGLDRYIYTKTKYQNYQIDEEFLDLQKWFFIEQLRLAKKHHKAVIIHNRQAKKDLLEILSYFNHGNYRYVFHCCEPNDDLLNFAINHKIFIGIDGDVTYNEKKREFVKKIPLDLLVLETDSPFLMPKLSIERSHHNKNEPKNLPWIAQFISQILNLSINRLIEITTNNAKRLFLR